MAKSTTKSKTTTRRSTAGRQAPDDTRPVITPDQAFEMYKAMGPGRAIAKVHRLLQQRDDVISVHKNTIEKWCTKYRWVERIEEYDAQVAGRVAELTLEDEAKTRWNAQKGFKVAAKCMVERIMVEIPKVAIETVEQLREATDIADKLISRAQLLPGGDSVAAEPLPATEGANENDPKQQARDDERTLARLQRLTSAIKAG